MINNKRAIVVGATSGMGREVALLLLSKGYKVGVTGRRVELLHSLKEIGGENLFFAQFDVSDVEEVAPNLERLWRELGGVDLFIHSSGTGSRNHLLDLDEELRTLAVNADGFTASINWAYHKMREEGSGTIAAITSIAGMRGFALSPSYSATKSFQISYLEALQQKTIGEKSGVAVVDIRAGFVDTAMGRGDGAFWRSSPARAARDIYKAVIKKRRVAFVTKRWILISWLLKVTPRSLFVNLKL